MKRTEVKPAKRKLAVASEVIRQLEAEQLVNVAGARRDSCDEGLCNNSNDIASCVTSREPNRGC